MIKSPAAFPFPGCYALHVVAGAPDLVRIIEWVGPQAENGTTVLVSYPLRRGASGNSQVPVAELIDATPLSANERIELARLEVGLAGKARSKKLHLAREAQLRTRWVNSEVRQRLIDEGVRRRLIDADTARLAVAA